MSLNTIPGLGKSGMSRIKVFRSNMRASAAVGRITRYGFSSCEATMPLTIRPATPADVPIIAEYNCRLARETEHLELDPATVTAGVAAAIADSQRKGPYFIATDGDDVVGQMQVTFEWSDWRNGWFWWVQSVYVRADYRGRGIFRSLYEHVRCEARSAGNVVGIRLYVEHENRPAQNTYRRLGMSEMPFYMMQELLS